LTVVEAFLLNLGGMGVFDALCHSFTTMASGGFSTKNASIGFWASPYIHYIITIFMVFSGINFTLIYYLFKRKFRKLYDDEELKWYLILIVALSLFISTWLYFEGYAGVERCFRDAAFQVVSILTTTGFATADYMLWHPLLWTLLLLAMISGGSAGSTNGGVKVVRVVIAWKNIRNEFKRFLHPNAVIPVKMNKALVNPQIITNTMVFLFVYIALVIFSVFVLTATGIPFDESIGASISAISNVGPGIGNLGPDHTYADVSLVGKWYISFLMLVGRLELFTVLLLFAPSFWKE
jgi:trk system potassium uptake protein TrkH